MAEPTGLASGKARGQSPLGRIRGVPAWHQQRSVQHPSTVLALRANPPPGASHGPRPPFGPHKGRR
ncbi:MAG: hypothetical protein EOR78_24505 [Mesorhizobium sp.]|nr:MAG: hypothetical protein EOR49_07405 [Mesorhizobium sp.]RWM42836.1 MAG: hypothetical protein EOR76_32560 [Mesorhizobium sp.]RWM48652.1 MAG: hypothetical protein EOR79_32285 [Mesorhizobium sp.]RWM51005.1 MAG: hypothetical protein EOR78_24505 [Mesorhizobium sp.]RWN04166.1 MAG: hypothetical protein EOR85_09450 [Mesorhizobium sp.]